MQRPAQTDSLGSPCPLGQDKEELSPAQSTWRGREDLAWGRRGHWDPVPDTQERNQSTFPSSSSPERLPRSPSGSPLQQAQPRLHSPLPERPFVCRQTDTCPISCKKPHLNFQGTSVHGEATSLIRPGAPFCNKYKHLLGRWDRPRNRVARSQERALLSQSGLIFNGSCYGTTGNGIPCLAQQCQGFQIMTFLLKRTQEINRENREPPMG